jgi:hypothetical protein
MTARRKALTAAVVCMLSVPAFDIGAQNRGPQTTNKETIKSAAKPPASFVIADIRSECDGGGRTRVMIAPDEDGHVMVNGHAAGAGYRFDMSMGLSSPTGGSMRPSYLCAGAELLLRGEVPLSAIHTFDGDKAYSLTFKMLKDTGLSYLCGRGTVTTKDGKTRLGYDDTVETWLPRLSSADTIRREAAAQALGALTQTPQESARVVPKLVQALGDPAFEVRRNAAEALGKIGDARAAQSLTSRTDETVEKDDWVREVAAEALKAIKK